MDKITDVVVIGFGAAGSAAAIEAADSGAEVLVLEKMRKPGGALAMSAGLVYGAGTSVQKAAGITDTADEMYKYYLATDNGVKDPALIRVLANKSGEAIEWLIKLGVDFPPENIFVGGSEPDFAHVTPPKPRSHHFRTVPGQPTYGGPTIFAVLEKAVKARKIDVMLETTATELVANSQNEVLGVKALSQGTDLFIRARRSVVLADGGFARNPQMVKQFLSEAPNVAAGNIVLTSHPGQTGDCIRMALGLGADLCDMQWFFASPHVFVPIGESSPYSPSRRYPSIFVNRMGIRFVNEDKYWTALSVALDKQDSVAFQIFDDRTMKGVNISAGRLKQLISAPTIGELARKLGIPSERLESTIQKWNRHAEVGEDPEFGRTGLTVAPIRTSPFWGGKLRRRLYINYGGFKTNPSAQVLRAVDGEPIPRLYAAGQTTGGRFGNFYPGAGSALADCFVFGRIAGKNAAAESPLE